MSERRIIIYAFLAMLLLGALASVAMELSPLGFTTTGLIIIAAIVLIRIGFELGVYVVKHSRKAPVHPGTIR